MCWSVRARAAWSKWEVGRGWSLRPFQLKPLCDSMIHTVIVFYLPLLRPGRSSGTSGRAANCRTLEVANPPGPSPGMVMWEQTDTWSTLNEHILGEQAPPWSGMYKCVTNSILDQNEIHNKFTLITQRGAELHPDLTISTVLLHKKILI